VWRLLLKLIIATMSYFDILLASITTDF